MPWIVFIVVVMAMCVLVGWVLSRDPKPTDHPQWYTDHIEKIRLKAIADLAEEKLKRPLGAYDLRHSDVPCPESPSGFCAHDIFDPIDHHVIFPYGPCLFCQSAWRRDASV